jgi:hypothetical protein
VTRLPLMQVTWASEAGGERANEDYAVTGPGRAVVLDGATAPAGVDSGCVHDVRWLVRQFAAAVALEYLSLADSAVLHARPGQAAEVFLDERTGDPPGGRPRSNEVARLLRNQPCGFWVASTRPEAVTRQCTEHAASPVTAASYSSPTA